MNVLDQSIGENHAIYNADCVDGVKGLPSDSIHYTCFSPPFASLYTYSNSSRDMGNCSGEEDFATHFRFLVEQLYRVTKPGRLLSFHCMNLPTQKARQGYIGISDFRGDLIRVFQSAGFIYHSEVCIGSELHEAVIMGRKAIGFELKPSYFRQAVNNLKRAEAELKQGDLFQLVEESSGLYTGVA